MKYIMYTLTGLIILLLLSGCDQVDLEERNDIIAVLDPFETAVESYDVEGMLSILDENQFALTIEEAGFSYDKQFNLLSTELSADEVEQLQWRKSPQEGGHGYTLDMVMGTFTLSKMSGNGGIATQVFEVYESAEDPLIPQLKTDAGTITWEMVRGTGEWKVVSMVISFEGTTVMAGIANLTAKPSGFGFGSLSW